MFDPALELRTRGRFWHQSVVELLNGNFLGAAIIGAPDLWGHGQTMVRV